MISIDNSVWKLLSDAPSAVIVKTFFWIATNQPEEGIHGFRTTKIQLAIDLNLKQAMIFRSIKWLKDNLLIQELKMAADFDFMTNPRFVMNNSDFTERNNEWNRRCHLDIDREIRLKRQKLLRNAKKEKINSNIR